MKNIRADFPKFNKRERLIDQASMVLKKAGFLTLRY